MAMASREQPELKLSLLTFNVGLLDYYIPGIGIVYCYPAFAEQRLKYIPDAIRRANADVVCLQEVYTNFQVSSIVLSLRDLYPYHSYQASPGWWKLQNGMLTLSKWPIVRQQLEHYKDVSPLEAWFGNKAQLVSTIDAPGIGHLVVINVHTTAGGCNLPTHPQSDFDRENELKQTIDTVRRAEAAGKHAVVIGDYNCGPFSSIDNFNFFRDRNKFRDLFTEAEKNDTWWSENGEPYTWHPQNILNIVGPHRELPSDRLDHAMISTSDPFWGSWHVSAAKILFTDTCVPTPDGRLSTISDHYAILFELSSPQSSLHHDSRL